ncbi:MAG TPA: PepSY-associated TM helix domain-containing protein [Allosphingosinicella sp.]|jgi:uncharacterized iron-regulated membrane protein
MASTNTLRLRKIWFQLHKWIGILLAILIIPVSLSGSALVWHDWLDETVNPQRHASAPPALSPGAYAAAAQGALAPGERVMTVTYPHHEGPVVVTAARPPVPGEGRPVRTLVHLDPADGRVLDTAGSNEGLVRVLHVLHGSLMVPGVGRQIVGWIGVAMLISALTGLWLWWPVSGSVGRGFRWKRTGDTNTNLHHQAGFWIAIPLAMLSFTGAWISFPAFFGPLSGAPAARPPQPPAQPLAVTALGPDRAVSLATPIAEGPLASIGWPTEKAPEWKVSYRRQAGGNAEVLVDDTSGKVTPPKPPQPETTARLMRRLHDGTGMGAVWQTIIFIGGIIPALLAVTGILMWLKSRRWRGDVARRKAENRAAA